MSSVLIQLIQDASPGDTKGDDKEHRRRVELIASVPFTKCCTILISPRLSSLTGAEVTLRSLSDRFVGDNYGVTAGDRQIVDDLKGDIRDAIHKYQVSGDVCVGLLSISFAEVLESDSFHNRRTSTGRTLA